jgi:hypothetical protein
VEKKETRAAPVQQERFPPDRPVPTSQQQPPAPIARQPAKMPDDPELERVLQEVRALPVPKALEHQQTVALPTPENSQVAHLRVAAREVRVQLLALEAILGEALREPVGR